MKTFMFNCGPIVFLVNVQFSTIGYAYPRLFVKLPDDSFINVDLTIGRIFGMSREDWDSWFDDTLVNLGTFDEAKGRICEETGMRLEALSDLVEALLKDIWNAAA